MGKSFSELYADEGLTIYTDGSCSSRDRFGGWAWVIFDPLDHHYMEGGSESDTTISRMELTAPAHALESVLIEHGPSVVLVISDSEYVVLGVQQPHRKRNKNVDLWLWLDEVLRAHEAVEFIHTRGHVGDEGNEMADKLAGEMRLAEKVKAK